MSEIRQEVLLRLRSVPFIGRFITLRCTKCGNPMYSTHCPRCGEYRYS